MNLKYCITGMIVICSGLLKAQQVIPLYQGEVPGAKQSAGYVEYSKTNDDGRLFTYKVTSPTLTRYLPQKVKANGASVIICPGGGYQTLAMGHEGIELAKAFNAHGITAFVLKYRLPNDSIMTDKTIRPLQDAQRAIQLVRQNAVRWNLDVKKVGIVGSSAGGHLAATAATHYAKSLVDNTDSISLRPDFTVLLYPVISFTQLPHTGTAKNLLGVDPGPEALKLYSNELQVTGDTPPTFLIHASDDPVVSVQHSILFYQSLLSKKVPAEIHLYEQGGHGFGLHNTTNTDEWFGRLLSWMQLRGVIKDK